MVVVLSHGYKFSGDPEYYKITCECGCKFVCSYHDFKVGSDDIFVRPNIDKIYIHCPDCHKKLYITREGFQATDINHRKTVLITPAIIKIPKEEYESLVRPDDLEE